MTQDTVDGTAKIEIDEDLLIPVHDPTLSKLNPIGIKEIRSSPYHEKSHWLDLTTIPQNYQIVSLALQSFHPIIPNYAFETYYESFNIEQIVELSKQYSKDLDYTFPKTEIYVIAFRSILHEPVQTSIEKRQFLGKIDKESHLEATESGGLIKYWFGTPDDSTGQNLATCWWVSKEHAKRGGGGKSHRQGMAAVKGWYKYWKVEEYQLVIEHNFDSFTFNRVV
ncbi:hypothetical protein DFJ63DRAFT_218971 [Scheffersomyces coipomensis]|uniref:uncharacterized protein n=1 Tax=Scheffersomyces coipomensis TaxID=1788519 RepID=UPI00315CE24E